MAGVTACLVSKSLREGWHEVAGSTPRRLLIARVGNERGDVLAGEFVQCLWGGPTGYLRSVETNGMGLVWWLRQVGAYEVIHTSLLKPAKERQL